MFELVLFEGRNKRLVHLHQRGVVIPSEASWDRYRSPCSWVISVVYRSSWPHTNH